jgi:hypothetical protein
LVVKNSGCFEINKSLLSACYFGFLTVPVCNDGNLMGCPMKILNRVFTLLLLVVFACSTDPNESTPADPPGDLSFIIDVTGLPDAVSSLDGKLERDGENSVDFDFSLHNGLASGSATGLSEGNWTLTLRVRDSGGEIAYTGAVLVSVTADRSVPYTLRFSPVTGTLSAVDATGGQPLQDQALVAWYSFNGSAQDRTANELNGIVAGAQPTYDRFGNPDHAYYFNGIDNYIRIDYDPLLDFTGSFTISIWAKGAGYTDGGVSNSGLIGKGATIPYGFALNGTNSLIFRVVYQDNWWENPWPNLTINTEHWYHYVGVFSAGEFIRMYRDGKEIYMNGLHVPPTLDASPNPLMIATRGHSQTPTVPRYYFKGSIDDIRLYNRALSTDEIVQLYTPE